MITNTPIPPPPTSPIITANNNQPQKVKPIYFLLLPLVIGLLGILLFVYFVYSDRQQKQKNYSAILMKYCTVRKECIWSNDKCVCAKSTIDPILETSPVPSGGIRPLPIPTITKTPTPTMLPIATLSATPIATLSATLTATPTAMLTNIPTLPVKILTSPTATPSATPTLTPTPASRGTLSMAVLGASVIQKGLLFTLLDFLFRKSF